MRMNAKLKLKKGTLAAFLTMAILLLLALPAIAAPQMGDNKPDPEGNIIGQDNCVTCHLNIAKDWSDSTHAHAFDDPVFQERWDALGSPGECLLCHTTNYQHTTGEYDSEGVGCEACHGQVSDEHPPAPVPIHSDTEYCGTCHTTTLGEWCLTGHAHADVGCVDCHNSHSQQALFTDPDDMCINCHQASMGEYLEDLHVQKDIGCVDCHALVIPPEGDPQDGIVPTGHSFTITPATCVACHTDALHAGFSLPGYEHGASSAETNVSAETEGEVGAETNVSVVEDERHNPAEQIRVLESELSSVQASLASRNLAGLFQGAVVGLVLGGTTTWIVASNLRQRSQAHHDDEEEE
jgi:hypothetical protein